MKILSLFIACWLGGGVATYHSFSLWIVGLYLFLSAVYLGTWLILRRGFYPAH